MLRRRPIVGLATALVAVVLPATAATAGTPVGTVIGVVSSVNERTPLYHLELEFSLANVQCPAVLDYELGGDTLSQPVDQCETDPDGFFPAATATAMRPMFGPDLGTINPSGTDCDGSTDRGPGCQVDVFVRHAEDPVELIDDRTLLDANGDAVEVWIPPRPVWVGVGDGYTSRVTQAADWCFERSADAEAAGQAALGTANVFADPAPDHPDDPTAVECSAEAQAIDGETGHELWYHPDTGDIYQHDPDTGDLWRYDPDDERLLDPGGVVLADLQPETAVDFFLTAQDVGVQSWINSVVQTFNLEFDINGTAIPCVDGDDSRCWEVEPEVIADSTTFAAHLEADAGDPSGQLAELQAILTGPEHLGSWNWIGLSAGLLDAGIPQAIRAEYPTDVDGYVYEPLDGTGYVPWRPANGDPCPALPTVSAAVAADVTAGIRHVVGQAMGWSPGLKSVVVRYPYLTEVTSSKTGLANPCAPANRAPIDALNAAVDAAIGSFPSSDDVFQLNLAADLDLQDGFTDEPTDSVDGRQSFLQLTRPYGYPYPSDHGASAMGSQAYRTIEESGLEPPTLAGDVVRAEDDDPATPSTGASSLHNGGWFRATDLYVEWQPDAPEGVQSLSRRSPLERGANRLYTGTVVDTRGQTAGAQATVSWDPDPPRVTSSLVGGASETTNLVTWWRSRPTIVWQAVEDENLDRYTPVNPPSGVKTTPAPTSVYPDGHQVVVTSGTAEDVAGNTATGTRTLNVDTVAPVVSGSSSTGTTWSRSPGATVVWSRSDSTSGLAGVSSHPDGYTGLHLLPGGTVSAEGRTTVTHTAYDLAGNATTASIDVLLDRTAPTLSIPQVPPPVDGEPAEVPADELASRLAAIADRGCDVVDAAPSPGLERSPIVFTSAPEADTREADGGLVYEFTCTSRDAAGNEGVATASFFVEVTDPPAVEGAYVDAPNAAGWWRTDVRIDWTATPAPGWSLLPYLGEEYGTSWNIGGDGLGGYRSTHTAEGVYPASSPIACHLPQPGSSCAGPITLPLQIDKTAPRVDPSYTATPASGWFRAPVTVSWLVADAVPLGLDAGQVSGVEPATLPAPVTAGEGTTNLTTGTVRDRAGNQASGSVTVRVDGTRPGIDAVDGVTAGQLHTRRDLPDANAVTCTAVDRPPASAPQASPSGVDGGGCKVARFVGAAPTDVFGPPIKDVSWEAFAKDVAGNDNRSTVTTRFLDVTPSMNGRMTVGAQLQTATAGRVSAAGTLRCNGSPNDLGVVWQHGAFVLDWIDSFYCWDQGDLEGSPSAPVDSLYGVGKGFLHDGRAATIEWTMADRDAVGLKGTMRIVIKVASTGQAVLDVGGVVTSGQIQAHEAQGTGTNDNGNVNGPTGNTSTRASFSVATLVAVVPEETTIR